MWPPWALLGDRYLCPAAPRSPPSFFGIFPDLACVSWPPHLLPSLPPFPSQLLSLPSPDIPPFSRPASPLLTSVRVRNIIAVLPSGGSLVLFQSPGQNGRLSRTTGCSQALSSEALHHACSPWHCASCGAGGLLPVAEVLEVGLHTHMNTLLSHLPQSVYLCSPL